MNRQPNMPLYDPRDINSGLALKMNAADKARGDRNAKEARSNAAGRKQEDIGKLVLRSIRNLKDRKGSSLIDIKKYMANKYSMDISAASNDIKRYLRGATRDGIVSLTGGKYKVKSVPRRRSRRRSRKGGAKKVKKTGRRSRSRRRRSKGRSGKKTTKSKGRSRKRRRASPKRKRSRRRSRRRGSKKGKK